MSQLIVRLEHMRGVTGFNTRPGLCTRGGRAWAERHGLDWKDFCRNGIDSETLLRTGDAFALAVVDHARDVEAARGR